MNKRSWTKVLFISVAVMMLASLGIMLSYVFQFNHLLEAKHRSASINQASSYIIVANTSSPARLHHRLAAMHYPNTQYSITTTPRWSLQFPRADHTFIERKLYNSKINHHYLQLSYQVKPKQWLNITVKSNANLITRYIPLPLLISSVTLFFSLLLIILMLTFVWSMQRFHTPLVTIRDAAKKLGIDLTARAMPTYGPKVVRDAIAALNEIQQRIQQLVVERSATMAALTHDIRTPLTRIKLLSELVDDPQRRQALLDEINEVEFLMDATMRYAKYDYRAEETGKLDLVTLLATLCDAATDSGHKATFTCDAEHAIIVAQPLNLKRAFDNLLSNALKYGDQASVHLSKTGAKINITITDNGPGIPSKELTKVFEPFYRGDNEKTQHTKGTGLGLNIAKTAIELNQGLITLRNVKPQGLQVSVSFATN